MKKRIKYCDLLRFLAIISVILIHVVADFRKMFFTLDKRYYFLFTVFDSLARTGVPLFFMFTGMFLLNNKQNERYSEFVKKTIKKLVIPLLFVSFIYYVYDCATLKSVSFSLFNFITGFYSNSIKYHLWYMYSIILIYLLIPFLKVGVQHLKKNGLRNLIILIFIFGFCTSTITQFCDYFEIPNFDGISYPIILTQLNYLFLGYYLYKYNATLKARKVFYILGILSLICIPVFDFILRTEARGELFAQPERIFPFFLTIALFIFVKNNYDKWHINRKIENFFAGIASLSLYIYLFHVLILEISRKIIYHFVNPSNFGQNFLVFIILLIITIVGTFILAYLFKRIIVICKAKLKINKKEKM